MSDIKPILLCPRHLDSVAQQWAHRLGCPIEFAASQETWRLQIVARDLEPGYLLGLLPPGTTHPIVADFTATSLKHRIHHRNKRDPFARALKISARQNRVLDATAGLGQDSWVAAGMGAFVDATERHPIIAALLESGLNLARNAQAAAHIAERITLHHADARAFMGQQPTHSWDVIYMDPMYPQRRKSALGKQTMRMFHALVGDDEDAASLLEMAQSRASRTVVKRPRLAECLGDQIPTHKVIGRSTRYDVYFSANK